MKTKYISAASGKEILILAVTDRVTIIQRHNGRDQLPTQTAIYNIKNKLWLEQN